MKKVAVLSIILILIVCILTACSPNDNFDTAILPKYDFTLNGELNGVGNIPFEDYLKTYDLAHLGAQKTASGEGANETASGVENANALNRAIDELSANGGGVLVIDGNYKTSTIWLKSNVSICLAQDCSLISVDYLENSSSEEKLVGGVISAQNAENIGIYGPGRIDGKGESFSKDAKETSPLQRLIILMSNNAS